MDGQKDGWMNRRTDERLKITPCVLQDIGPLPTDRWTDRRTDKKKEWRNLVLENRGEGESQRKKIKGAKKTRLPMINEV